MSKAHTFLSEVFGESPGKGLFIQLWTKGDKRTHYFRNSTEAAEFAITRTNDLYVAVSLAAKNYGPAKRAPAKESAGIPGVWADIDINGGPENKTGAAPDARAAEELAFAILEPTIVVNSGYGLQAWWLFDDGPWLLRDDVEREEAARLATGWIALLRERAADLGFGIDATQDLARLLRIPGSVNCKGGAEAPVDYFYDGAEWQGPRHSKDTLIELAREAAPAATAIREAISGLVGDFEIKPDAEPPYTKMEAALANSPGFKKTWLHERRDSAASNWSLSEYDLSLASMAVNMGWSDQEVADLLIAHRKKYGDLAKALRPDYLPATLAKARREQVTAMKSKAMDEHLDNLEAMATQQSVDPDAVMAEFNGVIGSDRIKVREIIQDGEDPKLTRYRLIIEPGGREVPIGPAGVLFNPDSFREAFGVVTGHVVMPVKRDRWLSAVQALLNVRRVHVAPDDTPAGIVTEWLGRYLGERMLTDQTEAGRRREPFEKDNDVYVYASSFHQYVTRSLGRQLAEPDLKQMLKAAGFTTKTISFLTEDGRSTSRSYYCGPRELLQ
jgi:hypothetical protein